MRAMSPFISSSQGLNFSQDLSRATGEVQVHAGLPPVPAFIVSEMFNLKKGKTTIIGKFEYTDGALDLRRNI